jgi:hypothetical protein
MAVKFKRAVMGATLFALATSSATANGQTSASATKLICTEISSKRVTHTGAKRPDTNGSPMYVLFAEELKFLRISNDPTTWDAPLVDDWNQCLFEDSRVKSRTRSSCSFGKSIAIYEQTAKVGASVYNYKYSLNRVTGELIKTLEIERTDNQFESKEAKYDCELAPSRRF